MGIADWVRRQFDWNARFSSLEKRHAQELATQRHMFEVEAADTHRAFTEKIEALKQDRLSLSRTSGRVIAMQKARHEAQVAEVFEIKQEVGGLLSDIRDHLMIYPTGQTKRGLEDRIDVAAAKLQPSMVLKQISPERLLEIAAIPDNKIDTSDIPEVSSAFFERATANKRRVS